MKDYFISLCKGSQSLQHVIKHLGTFVHLSVTYAFAFVCFMHSCWCGFQQSYTEKIRQLLPLCVL
jgi:hypothetical protein